MRERKDHRREKISKKMPEIDPKFKKCMKKGEKPEEESLDSLVRTLLFLLKEKMSRQLTQYHLSDVQGRTLGFIAHHENDEFTQKDLEFILHRRGSSITTMLKGLEKDGWITRQIDTTDERKKKLRLTPKARNVFQEFHSILASSEDIILKDFTPEEKKQFYSFFSRAIKNLKDENI